MKLVHPNHIDLIQERNKLLQRSLRSSTTSVPIADEYPIVLSAQNPCYSYCLLENNIICAHANLWPRVTCDRSQLESFQVGLIGNVATSDDFRGQGIMRKLFHHLEQLAVEKQLAALILWSDLQEFYHKLGFESLGKEYHFSFESLDLEPLTEASIQVIPPSTITIQLLERLLSLRYPISVTLKRTLEEYLVLTQIPNMTLFAAYVSGKIVGFSWVGKGEDMVGVIHEWGAEQPEYFVDLILATAQALNLDRIMVLSPHELNDRWHQTLLEESFLQESMPMGFVKILDESRRDALQSIFVWGVDSI